MVRRAALLVTVGLGIAAKGRIAEVYYLHQLEHGAERARWTAAKRLREMKSERSVPVLIEVYRKEGRGRPNSHYCAFALEKIGEPAARYLVAALKDDDEVRSLAYNTLSRMGSAAVPALIESLRGEDVPVTAGVALLRIRDPAVPALRRALEDGDCRLRRNAAEVLDMIKRVRIVD